MIMTSSPLCHDRPVYLVSALGNLDGILNDALKDVRTVLYPSANFVVSPTGIMDYYNDLDELITLNQGTSRIKELNPLAFLATTKYSGAGGYHLESGRIFLEEGSWCRICAIHETLHSVSIFAANKKIATQFDFLSEGITELFTGYVLWKRYPVCFDAWKQKIYYPEWCGSSQDYTIMARKWYTFCRFVDFGILKKLFFGIRQMKWSNAWKRFINDINSTHNGNFSCSLKGYFGLFEDNFFSELKRSFGQTKVEKVFEMESYNFDFSLI